MGGKWVKKKHPKVNAAVKQRKLTKTGTVVRKTGDARKLLKYKTGYKVKQVKGGKFVKVGERQCKVHTVCNCVKRTDHGLQAQVTNR